MDLVVFSSQELSNLEMELIEMDLIIFSSQALRNLEIELIKMDFRVCITKILGT